MKNKKFRREENLYCTDGHMQTAKVKKTLDGWKIFVLPSLDEEGEHAFSKLLFDTVFEDVITFNSMTGVGYAAVKKDGLWGLIRFRQDKAIYKKAMEIEPFDEKAMDKLGREIKLVEDIKYPDFKIFIKKYHLDNLNEIYNFSQQ
jgi:hypothetical protein